jgi:uncharacterized protein (DUF1786 family)
MTRILTIDIGAGTMDVLWADFESGEHFKAVVKSPVRTVVDRLEEIEGDLVILGSEMGGGAITRALEERARSASVVMSASAAATIHHDVERVRSIGIRVLEDDRARELAESGAFQTLVLCDVEEARLRRIVESFGVPFAFDVVGVCAQDHGVPPKGVSHLDFRHGAFELVLDETPFLHALLHPSADVPHDMNRLRSIAASAASLPAEEVYVMDSGMAAILGASMDPRVRSRARALVLDIATSHTVGAALHDEELCGFFEYHTKDITLARLETLVRELADGALEHARILAEGGHGAYTRRGIGFDRVEVILATGPKRGLIRGSSLPISLGAPLGDNMMTGTVGLLEAIRRRKGLEQISYA